MEEVRAVVAGLLSTLCSSVLVLALRLGFKAVNKRGVGGRDNRGRTRG